MRKKLIWIFVVSALLLGFESHYIRGDVVHLKNGGRLEGRITDLGDHIKIDTRNSSIEVNKRDIERREQKALPEDIFPSRLKAAGDDSQACLELARWALENNLETEYIQALRTALLYDQKNAQARKLLREYRLYHYHLPQNEKASQKMLDEMGEDFYILRTPHFRIAYNCSHLFADITGERLEKLYEEFMIFFEDRSFEPAPLTDRLEVILFENVQDFRRHAGSISPDMRNSSGFYTSQTGRSYFYDRISENNLDYQRNIEALNQHKKKIDEMRQSVLASNNPNLRYSITSDGVTKSNLDTIGMLSELDNQDKVLEKEYAKFRDFYLNQNVTVTIHEGTHQLAYHCGIHSIYMQNPKWLVEGLATFFEAPDRGQWHGPGMIHQARLKTFTSDNPDQPYISLRQLIGSDSHITLSESTAQRAYAASWALFYYLVRQDHENLFDYMYDLSLKMSNEPYTAQERIRDFEKYFGDIDKLEYNWRRYMIRLAAQN
ncbi:MAG: DUF1570 domain-containing protein [Sedimentisphaerales bacterium]|nr:DUF1570 domain-containing protein [Sedimentisphaerales bacterium]